MTDDLVTVAVDRVCFDTARLLQLIIGGVNYWLPKKYAVLTEDGDVEMPRWMAQQHEFTPLPRSKSATGEPTESALGGH